MVPKKSLSIDGNGSVSRGSPAGGSIRSHGVSISERRFWAELPLMVVLHVSKGGLGLDVMLDGEAGEDVHWISRFGFQVGLAWNVVWKSMMTWESMSSIGSIVNPL